MAKILIVDDSDVVAGMLEMFLGECGYATVRAENGLDGVIAAYREIPDLIISDVEMPRMQGYQMSRLLKSKRQIQNIPIVMHTSLSADKDRFWASSSGADRFVTKDFDNLDLLAGIVEELISLTPEMNRQQITEDGAEIDEERVMEMLGNMFDQELFRSTIMNELAGVEKYIHSLPQSSQAVLKLLGQVCEPHIAVLALAYGKTAQAFCLPSHEVYEGDLNSFREICIADFASSLGVSQVDWKEQVLGLEDRADFRKQRADHRQLSSYAVFPLQGKGNEVVGTLHIGNLSNNYFSGYINDSIQVFVTGAGMVLENAILFNRISSMESRIRSVFAKFVPPEVIDDLLDKSDGGADMQIGEKRNVAILFSDIRSFTSISENNTAEAVVSFLNQYFQKMVSEIRSEGGVIDKFIGDAILAVFGAPVSYEDNAVRAVRAAVAMIQALSSLPSDELTIPSGTFDIGIGIHEGSVIVGNIGSKDKFDYTVIGDNVNLAARLESITKHYRRKIIVSEIVAQKIGDEFPLRELDRVKVKGKETATTLYSVETVLDVSLSDEAAQNYKKGLQLYRIQNWISASEYFAKVLQECPEDFLSSMYIERCTRFQEQPPDDWDGSVALDFK